jgi:hypothetical protein
MATRSDAESESHADEHGDHEDGGLVPACERLRDIAPSLHAAFALQLADRVITEGG